MNEPVDYQLAGAVATITLNRPERLNAFTVEQHTQLRAAFEQALADPACRVIILTGAGRGFCAGQDLSDRKVAPGGARPDLGESLETYYNPLVRMIRGSAKPVVCAVNGVAAGAGANLALACDITIAGRSAKFIQAFSKIGLIPDSGGTWWLTHRIGEARAKALAMLAEPLTAEKAADWGLIWKTVDDTELMAEAQKIALQLGGGSPVSNNLTKRAIQAAAVNSLDEQLDLERDTQREAGYGADYAEGVAAFMEKRKPEFGKD